MNESDFDALFPALPFGTQEAARLEAQFRRLGTLAFALWGRDTATLEQKLLAPPAELLAGISVQQSVSGAAPTSGKPMFYLEDFRALLRHCAEMASLDVSDPRYKWLARITAPVVSDGSHELNLWHARYEIVRRALEYLARR